MIAILLLAMTCQAQGATQAAPTAQVPDFMVNRWPTGPKTNLPTGVFTAQLPNKSGVTAHGQQAQQFVAEAFAVQDADITDEGEPFLVLFGPDDATRQAADQIPADIASKIQVNRYDPDTKEGALKVREMGLKSGGRGTKAILMDAEGNVAYEGLFDLDKVLEKLRELLGLSEPDDEKPWFPNPLRPRVEIDLPWFLVFVVFGAGVGATLFVQWIIQQKKQKEEILLELARLKTQRPNG
jgi:hypothetical protein